MSTEILPAVRRGQSAEIREPLPYHRLMKRSPRSARWWRSLTVLGVIFGMFIPLSLPLSTLWVLAEDGLFGESWTPTTELMDPTNPMDIIIGLGLVAMLLPTAILGMRWGDGARGILHSVQSRVRWRMLLRAAAFVLPVYAVILVGYFVIDSPTDFQWPEASATLVVVYAAVILLTPLQCAAEEYLFRGVPMQVLGNWLRSPVWGILLPVPLFMIGHGYDWAGQIDLAVFAICMGALTWKTGGLELAIVMHTCNNLILFLLAPFSPSSLEQGAVDPALLLFSLPFTIGMTTVLWVWTSRNHGLRLFEPVTRS